jgi:glutaredoxin 2
MKLYHYIHCPFCVRVRLVLGLLKLPYKSTVLPYHDEQTPMKLTGVKMLPIMEIDGQNLNESLDIIAKLDSENRLNLELLNDKPSLQKVEDILSKLGAPIHNLCMPYWVWTPEFDSTSRRYFIEKKSKKRGPFDQLMQRQSEFLETLQIHLDELEEQIGLFFDHQKELTIFDVMISSHLWGMTLHPEFQFSEKMYEYLKRIKALCEFDYHEDYKSSQYF